MTAAITDFSRFVALRADANDDPAAALSGAAEEFEALFIQTMLQSMRDTIPEDGLLGGGSDAKMYAQLFDQQLARNLASGPGIGLAELLTRQLGSDPAAGRTTGVPVEMLPRVPAATDPATTPVASPQEFVRGLWPYAQRAATALGVEPRAIVAQAALETGWGRQAMQTDGGGEAHNYFGIKADSRWSGSSVNVSTLEFRDGVAVREAARFRAYPSRAAAFDDYVAFLQGSPRYAAVQSSGSDVSRFAHALSDAGYATDPAYADKLLAVASGETMQSAIAHLKFGGLTPMEQ